MGAEDSEGDYPAVEAPVEDLLEQAENALLALKLWMVCCLVSVSHDLVI